MRPNEAAEILKGVEQFEGNLPEDGLLVEEAWQMAISALKKQEQDSDKSCETCKYESYSFEESRCCRCFRGTDYEDYYEAGDES